jgi:hypothetical protein
MSRSRLSRLFRYPIAAALVATLAGSSLGAIPVAAAATYYPTDAAMILNGVSPEDLLANTRGVCNGTFNVVIRGVSSAANANRYLDAAQACGLKVVVYLATTVSSSGVVYPSRIAPIVNAIKGHPALFGYLSVKEPSWTRVSASEIKALYKGYKAADPNHPVVALFGDIPHFGDTKNPYTRGMANIVMVDWYPVETARGGCSSSGTTYIANGPKWYRKVNAAVHRLTPNVPIWVMVQTHKYLAPSCHKKQRPTQALLNRQVREALVYAHAKGIAFHTFENRNYSMDQRRDPTMVSWMNQISNTVRAGTFQ